VAWNACVISAVALVGPVIATIHGDGPVTLERRSVAVTAVHDLELDVTECGSSQEVRDRLQERLAAVNLEVAAGSRPEDILK